MNQFKPGEMVSIKPFLHENEENSSWILGEVVEPPAIWKMDGNLFLVKINENWQAIRKENHIALANNSR